jgi:hypothetical protein
MNCEQKLLHYNANINFNKICFRKELVPKYAHVELPTNNDVTRKTQTQA